MSRSKSYEVFRQTLPEVMHPASELDIGSTGRFDHANIDMRTKSAHVDVYFVPFYLSGQYPGVQRLL